MTAARRGRGGGGVVAGGCRALRRELGALGGSQASAARWPWVGVGQWDKHRGSQRPGLRVQALSRCREASESLEREEARRSWQPPGRDATEAPPRATPHTLVPRGRGGRRGANTGGAGVRKCREG